LLAIPASLGLMLLRTPLTSMLYQRGQFDDRSTELVAWALLWFAAGLVGHSVVEIVSRAFYSMHDTKTPVFLGIGAMGLNIIFSLVFTGVFDRIGWLPHGGLALANSLATALEMFALLFVIRRRLHGLESRSLLIASLQAFIATLLMSLAEKPAWQVVAGGILIGGMVYIISGWILRIREIRAVLRELSSRLAK